MRLYFMFHYNVHRIGGRQLIVLASKKIKLKTEYTFLSERKTKLILGKELHIYSNNIRNSSLGIPTLYEK